MLQYLDFKTAIRQQVFPQGEPVNLVAGIDKVFVDALIDLQTFVDCAQQDNTTIFEQCSTLYNCGLTVFDAPRGIIRSVSVVDKEDENSLVEGATSPTNYCDEITYSQINPCHIWNYLTKSLGCGFCLPIPLFFGLSPLLASKAMYPIPTDEGVTPGLPPLPLGYHYPQTSTDQATGRARQGAWAIERGKIFLAPWIQSTETIIVKWDGIKRSWADGEPIDDDPLLSQSVLEFVRWKYNDRWNKDPDEAARAQSAYNDSRMLLMHQCREENRVRGCEPSYAKSSSGSITQLFYNEAQSYTASCGPGQTGNSVPVTIPAGIVSSNISVADANTKALSQAVSQAQAALVCSDQAGTFTNDAIQVVANCQTDASSPTPDGSPVVFVVAAGTFSADSKAAANQLAQAFGQSQAALQLSCTWWNSAQTFVAHCPTGHAGADVTRTTPARSFSSNRSQLEADTLALNKATSDATTALVCAGGNVTFLNTAQSGAASAGTTCRVNIIVNVAAGVKISNISQFDANNQAHQFAMQLAQQYALTYVGMGRCGSFTIAFPVV